MAKDKGFDIGSLRHLITFQTPGKPRKDPNTGATVTPWVTVATVPAKVETLTGNELANVRQVYEKVSYRIRIRSDIQVEGKWRIVFPGYEDGEDDSSLEGRRIFEVSASFDEDEAKKFVRILAAEIKPG